MTQIEVLGWPIGGYASFGTADGTKVTYSSFLLDLNNEVWDLEQSEDQLLVENNARWLADQLGIPFETR